MHSRLTLAFDVTAHLLQITIKTISLERPKKDALSQAKQILNGMEPRLETVNEFYCASHQIHHTLFHPHDELSSEDDGVSFAFD